MRRGAKFFRRTRIGTLLRIAKSLTGGLQLDVSIIPVWVFPVGPSVHRPTSTVNPAALSIIDMERRPGLFTGTMTIRNAIEITTEHGSRFRGIRLGTP